MVGPTEAVSASMDHPERLEPCSTLLLCLTAGLLLVGFRTPRPADPLVPPPPSLSSLDPNCAPWWELTALPRIGEALALRIVNFRESATRTTPDGDSPVFACPADLAGVRGIGPKTVMRMAPYLRFDGS